MPALLIPRSAADAILADQGHEEAHRVQHILRSLKAIDPGFGMFLCDREDPENELRAGFWYVWRRGDSGVTGFWEVSAPDGSYVEPTEAVVEAFRQMEHDSVQDLRDRRAARERRRERREEERKALNLARLTEECDFMFRVSHAFPDIPWQRAKK